MTINSDLNINNSSNSILGVPFQGPICQKNSFLLDNSSSSTVDLTPIRNPSNNNDNDNSESSQSNQNTSMPNSMNNLRGYTIFSTAPIQQLLTFLDQKQEEAIWYLKEISVVLNAQKLKTIFSDIQLEIEKFKNNYETSLNSNNSASDVKFTIHPQLNQFLNSIKTICNNAICTLVASINKKEDAILSKYKVYKIFIKIKNKIKEAKKASVSGTTKDQMNSTTKKRFLSSIVESSIFPSKKMHANLLS